jgi:hypothetical protein
MARRTSGERERFWRDLIGRQPASGLAIAPFCKREGVSQCSFFSWKRRLGSDALDVGTAKTASEPGAKPTERSSRQKTRPRKRSFVPVRLITTPPGRDLSNPAAPGIEVQWPTGLVLRVPSGFDAGTLREVLQALQPPTDSEAAPC